jgi:hypothetical protein
VQEGVELVNKAGAALTEIVDSRAPRTIPDFGDFCLS